MVALPFGGTVMGSLPEVTVNSGRLLTICWMYIVELTVCVIVIVTLTLEVFTGTEPKLTELGEN